MADYRSIFSHESLKNRFMANYWFIFSHKSVFLFILSKNTFV